MSGVFMSQIGGKHYQKAVEPWDAMEAWMSHEEFAGFLRGNAIKYLARYKDKGGVEDLRKARHYLDKLIDHEMGPYSGVSPEILNIPVFLEQLVVDHQK